MNKFSLLSLAAVFDISFAFTELALCSIFHGCYSISIYKTSNVIVWLKMVCPLK